MGRPLGASSPISNPALAAREAGATLAQLGFGQLVDGKEAVRLAPDEVRRLRDPGPEVGARQVEERLHRAVVVERAMKAGALERRAPFVSANAARLSARGRIATAFAVA